MYILANRWVYSAFDSLFIENLSNAASWQLANSVRSAISFSLAKLLWSLHLEQPALLIYDLALLQTLQG